MKELWSRLRDRLSKYAPFRLLFRYEELIRYGIAGVLTTAVNFAVYLLLSLVIFRGAFEKNEELYALLFNWIAWGCAVLFAFVANRAFVFERKDRGRVLAMQFFSFVALRIVSGVIENSAPSLLISFGMDDLCAKATVSVAVIVLNYLFTKFVTFARRKTRGSDSKEISDRQM